MSNKRMWQRVKDGENLRMLSADVGMKNRCGLTVVTYLTSHESCWVFQLFNCSVDSVQAAVVWGLPLRISSLFTLCISLDISLRNVDEEAMHDAEHGNSARCRRSVTSRDDERQRMMATMTTKCCKKLLFVEADLPAYDFRLNSLQSMVISITRI